jgi:glycosyltransferase involved in cell wall biosynthesis
MQQTFQPKEIIVIDDGSIDETSSMINDLFPNVKYLYQKNNGVSSARNKGIKLATGDWIAFLDSDDQWLPEKLEKQQLALKRNPEIKLCHTEEIWIRNGIRVNAMKKHSKKGGWIFQHCLPLCAISPSAAIIHRSVFDTVGLFDESLPACEDYDMWLRITAKYPVIFLEDALIKKFGGHEDQLSQKHWGMDRFRIQALQKILDKNELSKENRQAAYEMLLKKAQVFLNGAQKRGKTSESEYYEQLIKQYG